MSQLRGESVNMNNENREAITIHTRDFGDQEVFLDEIIVFPKGLFAFENAKRFALLSPLGDENSPMWLQNVDEIAPCFIVFKPVELFESYSPEIDEEDLAVIKLEDGEEIEYLSIAVIPEDYKKTTINLKSPIIINRNKRIAVQAILQQNYELKFPIYKTIEEA